MRNLVSYALVGSMFLGAGCATTPPPKQPRVPRLSNAEAIEMLMRREEGNKIPSYKLGSVNPIRRSGLDLVRVDPYCGSDMDERYHKNHRLGPPHYFVRDLTGQYHFVGFVKDEDPMDLQEVYVSYSGRWERPSPTFGVQQVIDMHFSSRRTNKRLHANFYSGESAPESFVEGAGGYESLKKAFLIAKGTETGRRKRGGRI